LPLSRRLAALLGGTLDVESSLGLGSTFALKIPAQFGQSQPHVTMPSLIEEGLGSAILFIEDNRETSFVHQSALKNSDYRSLFVSNIPEARIAMKQIRPKLVVLDRLIDEKDCLYYIEELKGQGYSGPILVVSVVDDAKSATDAGASAFLAKPVPPFTLLNTVRELIEEVPLKAILLVDDDEVTRYLVGGALAKVGYRILEAHGGREAVKLILSENPDAIILDIAMPDMTGFEVLREIRGVVSSRTIPVIVHSSRELSKQERSLIAGFDALIYSKQSFTEQGGPQGLVDLLQATGIGA
jgi:DNA-binding response OmpR family regulator